MVERVNREIGRILRAFCHSKHPRWAYLLEQVQMWINRAVHTSTGFTPNELHFGKENKCQISKNIEFPPSENVRFNFIELARAHLLAKAERRRLKHGNSKMLVSFKPGDKVLVKTHNQSSAELKEIKKFFLLYEGPYIVHKVVNENAYLLLNENGILFGTHNIYNLKRFKEPVKQI